MNINIFNLTSRINQTRHVSCYETCACKCRLDASVCNDKQHWSSCKCKCEWKKLIGKGRCDDEFI